MIYEEYIEHSHKLVKYCNKLYDLINKDNLENYELYKKFIIDEEEYNKLYKKY